MEIHLTPDSFQKEVIESELPVLVDFWAPWCGPCQMIAPVVEQIATEQSGKLKVCKLNVDEAPNIATKYSIMSIPALILFKSGDIMEKSVGALSKGDLDKFVQPYL